MCLQHAAASGSCANGAKLGVLQDKQDVGLRRQVQEHILAGQIPEAMASIEQAAAGTLDNNPRVKFQLHCQQFVEMVCLSLACAFMPLSHAQQMRNDSTRVHDVLFTTAGLL